MKNFLFGLMVGVGAGLLMAPAEGSETRDRLAKNAGKLKEYPRRKVKEDFDFARRRAGDIGSKAAENAFDETRRRVVGENWP